MDVLGYSEDELHKLNGYYTATEINQQPALWYKIWKKVYAERLALNAYLEEAILKTDSIILTGAGTSAFIGLSLKAVFDKHLGMITEPISTTDLVSHPQNYLSKKRSVLLVSFARSGDSPESMAVVDLADKFSKHCFHLIITCNEDGKLANGQTQNGKYIFLLPKEANDKSLAMTSSYSGMLLAGILIARVQEIEKLEPQVKAVCSHGKGFIEQRAIIRKMAMLDFKRAVFLGSGPLFGTAKEAHLKVQELTDGMIICKFDSYLGFRHGPKAVVDNTTLILYFFSNQVYVLKYEKDLVNTMSKGNEVMDEIGVIDSNIEIALENVITFHSEEVTVDEEFLSVCSIIPAQLLGFYKSINLGLSPDNPSKSGAISRVVQGVTIYGQH